MRANPSNRRSAGPPLPRVCERCGATFLLKASRAAKGEGRYCSTRCYASARTRPLVERFWERVAVGAPGDCWPWMGPRNALGYGAIGRGGRGGRPLPAHRVGWELTYGPIRRVPGEKPIVVCHRCDNPPCCNPAHLFLGEQADNLADMWAKGRGWIPHHTGTENRQAKLTDAAVSDIRATADVTPATIKRLAVEYGVSTTLIRKVLKREIWRHVC